MTELARVVLAAAAALFPDPDRAHEWLRRELDGREYQPSLADRFWHAVQDLFDKVRDATVGAGGFSPGLALVALVVLVVAGAFLLSRLHANPAASREDRAVFTTARASAAEHRARARRAMEAGDWDTAVVETTRALAAGLFERGLVREDSGATADEIAALAAGLFPDAGDRLVRAAVVFDETMYGDRPADRARAAEVADLEEELRSATPRPAGERAPVAAVPR